jgi:uncharacterized protein (DUF2267 family)
MDFNKYAAKGNEFLDELAIELGFPENRKLSGRILRSTLHALRDLIPVEESFQLISQLPFVITALYIEEWKFHKKGKRIKHVKDFVKKVIHEDFPVGHHDFQTAKDGENAVMAVFKVLRRHVSAGEIDDILATMPKELHKLWGAPHLNF